MTGLVLAVTLTGLVLTLVFLTPVLWFGARWVHRRVTADLSRAEGDLKTLEVEDSDIAGTLRSRAEAERTKAQEDVAAGKMPRLTLSFGADICFNPWVLLLIGMAVFVPVIIFDVLDPLAALILLAIVIVALRGTIRGAIRREALRVWSRSRGLKFDPARDYSVRNRLPGFPALSGGSDSHAHNRVFGTWREGGQPRALEAFDYYRKPVATHPKEARVSVVLLQSEVPLKPLYILPRSALDAGKPLVGVHDIEFESVSFNQEFFVWAEDRRWAYDVLHARTIQFLLDQPRFTVILFRQHALATRNETMRVAEFEQAIRVLQGILDGLPSYVANHPRPRAAAT